MKRFLSFLDFIDNMNEWIGKLFSVMILALTFVVLYEVIMRKFFAHPSTWSYEVSRQTFGFYFMIVGGYALLYRRHVAVDIITSRFSRRVRSILEVICYVMFFFPFWGVMLWFGCKFAAVSWQQLETARDIFPMPLYPIKTIIPVGALLMLLQGLSGFVKNILIIRGREV
jgi:TRAP-type mannitol/chloroaromatic compound transport system permease small subunit